MTIIDDRLAILDTLTLHVGGHSAPEGDQCNIEGCLLEVVSWLAGEKWTDRPKCASNVIGAFGRSFNDNLDDEGRQRLLAFAPKIVGTNTGRDDENKRAWLICNWMLHVHLPAWLDAAGMTEQAALVRAVPEISSWKGWTDQRALIIRVRDDAWARRRDAFAPLRAAVKEAVERAFAEKRTAANAATATAATDAAAAAADAANAANAADAAATAAATAADAANAANAAAATDAAAADAAATATATAAAAANAANAADAAATATADAAATATDAATATATAAAANAAATDATAATATTATTATTAVYGDVWRAVYDATLPVFRKAIDEHPVVGPVARSMKESGFELLEQLCAIGRT